MNQEQVSRAEALARTAHSGQVRKDGAQYIVHPERVAKLLDREGFSNLTIAAGWLHDVLEDTDVPEETIRTIDPDLIPVLRAVTENKELPWVERKMLHSDAVANGPEEAKAVACADRIDNLTDFLGDYKLVGPDLWKRWPNRTSSQKVDADTYFLGVLEKSWNHPMLRQLEKLIEEERMLV